MRRLQGVMRGEFHTRATNASFFRRAVARLHDPIKHCSNAIATFVHASLPRGFHEPLELFGIIRFALARSRRGFFLGPLRLHARLSNTVAQETKGGGRKDT